MLRAALRENWALYLGMSMVMTANGLLVTLLSLRGLAIGFSETEIGVMQAAYPLGALFGASIAPRMIERIGHVRAFGVLASLCSVAAVVHLMTESLAAWIAMRGLAGFCFPALYVIAESWLNAKAGNAVRGSVLALYFVIQILGSAFGAWLAGFHIGDGAALFGISSILISVSLAPLLLFGDAAPTYRAPRPFGVVALFKTSPMAALGSLINGVQQAAFYVGAPLYGAALELSDMASANLLVIGTLVGALAQFPIAWISDRMDRRRVISLCSALAPISIALAIAFSFPPVVIIALIAASVLPIYSICVAHANDHLDADDVSGASGALVLMLNLGLLFGAFCGPTLIGLFGAGGWFGLFFGTGVLTLLISVLRQFQAIAPEPSSAAHPISAQGAQRVGDFDLDAGN